MAEKWSIIDPLVATVTRGAGERAEKQQATRSRLDAGIARTAGKTIRACAA